MSLIGMTRLFAWLLHQTQAISITIHCYVPANTANTVIPANGELAILKMGKGV